MRADGPAAAVVTVHRALDGLHAHEIVYLEDVAALARTLAEQMSAMRKDDDEPLLHHRRLPAGLPRGGQRRPDDHGARHGPLRFFLGGDLTCETAGSTLRGGQAHVGGRVRVNSFGAPGASPITIILEGPTRTPDRLRAAVAHEGVVVVCGGEKIGFDATRVNLTVGTDDENRVTHASLSG